MSKVNVALYGIGNFGYALLKHLDRKADGSFSLRAYDYDQTVTDSLKSDRAHPYIQKSARISDFPEIVGAPEELLEGRDVVILAVSSDVTREVVSHIKKSTTGRLTIVNTAKALDKEDGRRLSEVIAEELKGVDYTYALLAGGTIAADLFRHEPLGIDIASRDEAALKDLQRLFESDNLHVYTTTDLTGVEYAAAFKNVISILAGIVHGLGFSYGAETHAISKLAAHIAEACVQHLGARPDTFTIGRQAWGNDMWMSATGNTRNRKLGILLGQGVPAEEALAQMQSGNKLVEGVNTLKVVDKIPGIKDIEAVSLLKRLIVDGTASAEDISRYLMRTHL
jgi:glycerol-3-phosphate dehydrogenase (NAD(P)+)